MVSIIVPTFNRELYIEECIRSVIAQTYTDWELLIIDDGSDDSTIEICTKMAEGEKRMRIFNCEHHGVSFARNTGLKESEGDFVFFLDSDDLIHPSLLSRLTDLMKNQDIGAACCRLRKFSDNMLGAEEFNTSVLSEISTQSSVLDNECFIEELFNKDGQVGAIGGKLIRKSRLNTLTFREDISKGEDTFFLYNYALGGGNLAICDDKWYFYRMHSNNSASVLKAQFDIDDYLKANTLMHESESKRGNQKNARLLKWYIIDNTLQLFELAREQKNKKATAELRRKMIKTLLSDRDGVATKKITLSFIINAYCHPLFKIIRKMIGAQSEPEGDMKRCELKKDLVSIVTPVYNNESYLAETLDAILNQTYDNIQMLLVDDGSSDKTSEIAESYRDKFAKRGYEYTIIYAEHKNASAAINKGLPLVKGEYLIWPDSDDLLTPDSVEKRAFFLKARSEYAAVRSLPEYFDTVTRQSAKARETITMNGNEHIFWDILEGRSYVSCGCYMLRSADFFEIYPDRKIPEYNVGQNFQMLLPFMYRHKCATIAEPLYQVRVHDGSHSVRTLSIAGQYRVIKDFEKLIDDIARICNITDQAELKRINEWKKRRRIGFKMRTLYSLWTVKLAQKIYHKLKKR